MKQYVNNSDCINLDIDEVEECSLGPEYSVVDVKHILRTATREARFVIEVFSVKARDEHLVASKWRRDDCQRQKKSKEEKAWKKSQGREEEDKWKWCVAYEDATRKILKYLEHNEDVKVDLSELKVESSVDPRDKRERKKVRRLEPEGEAEKSEVIGLYLCLQCSNERLTAQGLTLLKSWQWNAVVEKTTHLGRLENVGKDQFI